MKENRQTYIKYMDWKEKLKWKLLIILIAFVGILIVWCAGKAGKEGNAQEKVLREQAVKENEQASILSFLRKDETEEIKEEQGQELYGNGPQIKVLLMTTGYQGYYHGNFSVKAQGNYRIQGTAERILKSGEILELSSGNPELAGGSLTLLPEEEGNRLQILSLERAQGNPSYPGKLTVYQDENGLRLINSLPLEQYLCGVVPSEMPASYPMEALKAQAVCARTYACVQLQGSKLEDLGAQVDDSVSFQVYQNTNEAEASNEAVRATAGQILLNQGKPIVAYYFSTSHGKTSTDEVWEASVPSSYLKSVDCTYDSAEPWYQWQVSISKEKLLANVKKIFPEVKELKSLEIREKGEGDAVLHLAVYTDAGEKELHSEYEIRSILAPAGLAVIRKDGSEVKGGSLLPSAYFTLEEQKNERGTTGYLIRGGGYGHGVGMSQNGARGMADSGKEYREILSYFYKDVQIGDINNVVKSTDS